MKIATLVLSILIPTAAITDSSAQEATNDSAGRPSFREPRPNPTHTWVIIEKKNYWPLCYEALERLESLHAEDTLSDKNLLTERLDKCTAWLGLAASASMLNPEANIYDVIDHLDAMSLDLEENGKLPSKENLNTVATMGELSMAKSHVVRAERDYSEPATEPKKPKTKSTQATVGEAEKEIRQDRIARNLEQYRYDTSQSIRHLAVAKVYLETAAKHGGFESEVSSLPETKKLRGDETISELANAPFELSRVAKEMSAIISKHQADLEKTLPDLN
ncbi:hypothetical protein NHH03_26960 [Stieleria sp. TO1_6]|uniref:hypothetical protein n=1 Tax=Stieleria tagensis TaxID=2956795 RepID=UPI00209B1714|nr:hypothetical protein [Stieleria tagensis]MCO8125409.1 hypothetical protein [Stieleria tagensis]